jgi:predicted flavoprotein YhiN
MSNAQKLSQAVAGGASAPKLGANNFAVAAADRSVQIEREFATEIARTWPTLLVMQIALGMTDMQVDDLFVAAGKL